jgi:hypothetical protein
MRGGVWPCHLDIESHGAAGGFVSAEGCGHGSGYFGHGRRNRRRSGELENRLHRDAFLLHAHFHLRRSVASPCGLAGMVVVAGTIFSIERLRPPGLDVASTLRVDDVYKVWDRVIRDDRMTFKVFTSFTYLNSKDLNVYRSFTNCLHSRQNVEFEEFKCLHQR